MGKVGKRAKLNQEDGVPKLDGTAPNPVPKEVPLIANNVLESIRTWYSQEVPMYSMDQVLLNKIISSCFVQYSAVLAIDCGVDKAAFMKVVETMFDAVYASAPKFGE